MHYNTMYVRYSLAHGTNGSELTEDCSVEIYNHTRQLLYKHCISDSSKLLYTLTRETDRADMADVNQTMMTEAGGMVVYLYCRR